MKSKFHTIPKDLVESILKKECILFVASGLSSKAIRSNGKPLPSWTGFLKELLDWAELKRVPFNSDPKEILEMIDKGSHLMAAEELQELINHNEFTDFLNAVFRERNIKPTIAHQNLTKIPFRAILTTNYDNLIEGAFAYSNQGQIPKKFTKNDLSLHSSPLRSKDFFIFKMHGDIDRSDTIVLGSRSYNNLVYKSPEYLSFLETLFTTHTVLFIGFGGSDPDLDYLLDRLSTIFSRTLNKHFILVPNNKFNFTEKRRLLLDKRLEVIDYDPKDNHAEVDNFIGALLEIITETRSKDDNKPKKKIRTTNVQIFESMSGVKDNDFGKIITDYIDSIDGFHVNSWGNFDHYFNTEKPVSIDDFFHHPDEWEEEDIPKVSIIIISKKELQSNKFEKDIEIALLKQLEERNRVIPILIGDVDIPFKLRNFQYLKLNENFTKKDLTPLKRLLN